MGLFNLAKEVDTHLFGKEAEASGKDGFRCPLPTLPVNQ